MPIQAPQSPQQATGTVETASPPAPSPAPTETAAAQTPVPGLEHPQQKSAEPPNKEPIPGLRTEEQQKADEAANQAKLKAQHEAEIAAANAEAQRQAEIQAKQEEQRIQQEAQQRIVAQQQAQAAQAQQQAEAAAAAKTAEDEKAFAVNNAPLMETDGSPIPGADASSPDFPGNVNSSPEINQTTDTLGPELTEEEMNEAFKGFDPLVKEKSVNAFKLYFAWNKLSRGNQGAQSSSSEALTHELVNVTHLVNPPEQTPTQPQESPPQPKKH